MKYLNINLLLTAFSLVCVMGSSPVFSQACTVGHCGGSITAEEKEACMKNSPTKQLYVKDPNTGKLCWCPCSCFANGTKIQTSSGLVEVEKLVAGQTFESVERNVEISSAYSSPADGTVAFKISYDGDKSIVVTDDHPMILEGQIVREARKIKEGDKLLNAKGQAVTVTNVTSFPYQGSFHSLTAKAEAGSASDRIIIAEGIQTGDDTVSTYKSQIDRDLALKEVIAAGEKK